MRTVLLTEEGEGGDAYAVSLPLERRSFDTHRRELCYSISEPVALFAMLRQAPGQL